MISLRQGKVTQIKKVSLAVTEVTVQLEAKEEPALNYNFLTGPVAVGDRVLLNTTAAELNLGSGGYHFVVANLSQPEFKSSSSGHIMKLRYTPLQQAVLAVEEQSSPHHQALKEETNLNGLPVIIGSLHSQLLPVVAAVKTLKPNYRLAYIMTDGGALPLALSQTVRSLKEAGYIQTTITAGHAFGGDLEAVNIYSALLAAKVAAKADVVVVTMGPGITGTGTYLGHTGLEQGQVINAVAALNGLPIALLRLSQEDKRERHLGISHHCLTALQLVALAAATVPVPLLKRYGTQRFAAYLKQQLVLLKQKHKLVEVEADAFLDIVRQVAAKVGLKAQTMGRSLEAEPYFFAAAACSGQILPSSNCSSS